MALDHGGWWRVDVPDAGAGAAYAFLLDDDETPLPDPRSRWQPGGRALGVAALRPRRVLLDRPRLDRPPAARQRALRAATSARSPTAAPSTPRSRSSTTSSRWASTWSRCCPSTPSTATATGATTASAGTPSPRTTAARTPSSASSTPATRAGSAWSWTSSTTTWARRAPTSTGSAPTSRAARSGARRSTSTARTPSEVRRYVIDNALMWLRDYHLDGLRLDAVHALHDRRAVHLLEQMTDRGRGAVGAPRPAAVADRRVGPQRRRGWSPPATAAATGCTRSGPTTSTTACTPRSPARTRATTPTSRPPGSPGSPTC